MIYVFLLGFINGLMDSLQFRYRRSFFGNLFQNSKKWEQFWNPEVSYKNKYSTNPVFNFLKSTVFVYFTDGWHLLKLIFILLLGVALFLVPAQLGTYITISLFVVKVLIYFSIGFNLAYEVDYLKIFFLFLFRLAFFRDRGLVGILQSIMFYLFIFAIIYGIIYY